MKKGFIAFIDDKKQEVFTIEDLKFNHSLGAYIKIVSFNGKEIVVYRYPNGIWKNFKSQDKLQQISSYRGQ